MNRRRASVYVAVLSVSLLVTVIGLGALLAARVGLRDAALTGHAVQADLLAQSAADLVLFRFCQDDTWRATQPHDLWSDPEQLDGGTFTYRVVDELDGNLAADAGQPFRLHVQATTQGAVRLYSVLVTPLAPVNRLSNGGFEAGTVHWAPSNGVLEVRTTDPHGGTAYAALRAAVSTSLGATQPLAGRIVSGTQYHISVWVRAASGTVQVVAGIVTESSGSGQLWFQGDSTFVGPTWTQLSGTVTPTWSGSLAAAYFYVGTTGTALQIDDALLALPLDLPPLAPVPGTWRREVLTFEPVDPVEGEATLKEITSH